MLSQLPRSACRAFRGTEAKQDAYGWSAPCRHERQAAMNAGTGRSTRQLAPATSGAAFGIKQALTQAPESTVTANLETNRTTTRSGSTGHSYGVLSCDERS